MKNKTSKCIICEKEFEKYPNSISPFRNKIKIKRKRNCITCSKECAKIYDRVRHRIKYFIGKEKNEQKR